MTNKKSPSIGIIGLGVWGTTLVRVMSDMGMDIHGTDKDNNAATGAKRRHPALTLHGTTTKLLNTDKICAVIVATPPSSHTRLALRALRYGKHVLIEKPIAQNTQQVKKIHTLAVKNHLIVMADYTYLYSPAVRLAKKLLQQNTIGRIHTIESVRLKGRPIPDSTVLSDFASHDISIGTYLHNAQPVTARTIASDYRLKTSKYHAVIELYFPRSVRYIAHLSWASPVKVRLLSVHGTKGSITVRWENNSELVHIIKKDGASSISKTTGEPLQLMLSHFVDCIRSGTPPLSDTAFGQSVVRTTGALMRSWKANGRQIAVQPPMAKTRHTNT